MVEVTLHMPIFYSESTFLCSVSGQVDLVEIPPVGSKISFATPLNEEVKWLPRDGSLIFSVIDVAYCVNPKIPTIIFFEHIYLPGKATAERLVAYLTAGFPLFEE